MERKYKFSKCIQWCNDNLGDPIKSSGGVYFQWDVEKTILSYKYRCIVEIVFIEECEKYSVDATIQYQTYNMDDEFQYKPLLCGINSIMSYSGDNILPLIEQKEFEKDNELNVTTSSDAYLMGVEKGIELGKQLK